MAAGPPKKNLGDDEHLELAEGWDQAAIPAAKGQNASAASLASNDDFDDWDTPLEDVSWDEPGFEEKTPPSQEVPAKTESVADSALLLEKAESESSTGEKNEATDDDEHPVHLLELAWEDEDDGSDPALEKNLPPVEATPQTVSQATNDSPKSFDSHLSDADDDFENPDSAPLQDAVPPPPVASSDFDELEGHEPPPVASIEQPSPTEAFEKANEETPPSDLEKDDDPASGLSPQEQALVEEHLPTDGKVELDIEGMSLDNPLGAEEHPAEDPAANAPPAAEDPPEASLPPAEEAPVKKIPKLKLLLILGPAVLVLLLLVFGAYKLFFSKPAPVETPQVVQVDHWPAAKNEGPGDKDLEPFLLILPGPENDYLIKTDVTIFYTDYHWFLDISDQEVVYRDIIYRLLQNQTPDILKDVEAQHRLGEDIKNAINQRLGSPGLDFVRLEFRPVN